MSAKIDAIKPAQRRRYEFIEFQLKWEGTIGRKLLQQKFEMSPQQATLDLTSYLDLVPRNMSYDPRRRTYVVSANFKPLFIKGEASEYLVQLEMLHHGYRQIDEIWPTTIPAFDAVAVAARRADASVLQTVLRAIRDHGCVEAMYVSLSSKSGSPRRLYPHAIASDGHRWHMRAYDSDNERFSDFVLSRIEKLRVVPPGREAIPEDTSWATFVNLRMRPDPALDARQRERLAIEYDMSGNEFVIRVRQAMLYYYLRFYGFNPRDIENNMLRNKSSYSLHIVNLKEIDKCIGRRD